MPTRAANPIPRRRLALLALGGIALFAGLGGALVLLGVTIPPPPATFAASHGVLMALGFLGTVIALERAVALGAAWGYLAPLAAGAGGLATMAGIPWPIGPGLFTVAAATYTAIYAVFMRREPSLHGAVQAAGALAWLGAAITLLAGIPVSSAAPWLVGYLVLTVAGERLELSRVLRPTPRTRALFTIAVGVFTAGVALSVPAPGLGVRLTGAGLVLLAAWLLRFDIARRTIRGSGVTRYIGVCLFLGYGWMAVGGVTWLLAGPVSAGPAYDTALHAIFLGFVASMVFGHAPVILPAVLRVPLPYSPPLYVPVILLHGGLLLRVAAVNLLGMGDPWRIGATLTVLAMLDFVAGTVFTVVDGLVRARAERKRAERTRAERTRADAPA